MNKPLGITLTIVVGVLLLFFIAIGVIYGLSVWDEHNRTVAQEDYKQELARRTEQEEKAKTKYDIGPPDPQEIFELVNIEREKVGAEPLVMDDRLNISAQNKARDFVERDYYEHYVMDGDRILMPDDEIDIGLRCSYIAENIAADDLTSSESMRGWMNSQGHREAILNTKYKLIGIGVAKNTDNRYYAVQHFCIPK